MTKKKTRTRPIGKGTRNISLNMPEQLRNDLVALAQASGMTLSAYLRMILTRAVERGTVFQITEHRSREHLRVAEPPPAQTTRRQSD